LLGADAIHRTISMLCGFASVALAPTLKLKVTGFGVAADAVTLMDCVDPIFDGLPLELYRAKHSVAFAAVLVVDSR
jgi:hypothetical protein